MENNQKAELIQKVITFIKKERELYGDFPIQDATSDFQADVNYQQEATGSVVREAAEANVNSANPDQTDMPKAETSASQNGSKFIYARIDECDTLEELEELCRHAEVLHTDLERTQLVFGVGNPTADLMLIGEAPGAEEDKQGEPFVGAAGKLLNKILEAVNFEREDVYIANILKHRPPNNRNPLPEERERSLPFLLKQIDLINPKLILALGKVSAQTLLDSSQSLGKMRGTFHPFRDKYEVLATYHPAALLRYEKWKRPTWEDVQMLRKRYDELNGKP